jgi:serine/threonine protein kinase/formylglycine-generating enzyme required for sulfatase activity
VAGDGRAREESETPGRAEALFAEYVQSAKDGVAFDDFLAGHPEQADALRAVHSLWVAGELATAAQTPISGGGRSLQAALSSLAAPLDSPPLERVGPYRITEVLGEGGFGVVYRAEQDAPFHRTVALKVIKLGMDTRETVARFEAERQALALMSHPAIAKVHDAGATENGRPYFVMEFIQGEPITLFCERRDLNVDARLDLFLTVCEAVEHAHQKGVIHRDLKPSNVLVGLDAGTPLPKVIDFGIAKAMGAQLTEHTLQTGLGQILGTPAYMSPEQADLGSADIDTRSDVYSLGVILYELLAGVRPFEREAFPTQSLEAVLRFIREAEPQRPSTRLQARAQARRPDDPAVERRIRLTVRRLRGDLDWIVLKAMAKDRERRYGRVADLAQDLRRHLRHEPVSAGPPGIAYRMRKFARKHRVGVGITAALFLTALLGGAGLAYRAERDFARAWGNTQSSIDAKDLKGAQAGLAVLRERHYGRAQVRDLEQAVAQLENTLRSKESARHLDAARQDWESHLEQLQESHDLERAWREKRLDPNQHAPPWERSEEFAIHDRLEAARRDAQDNYNAAIGAFQRAIEAAPRDSVAERQARKEFAAVYQTLQSLADREGALALGPDFFRRRGADLDAVLFARKGGTVRIWTRPAGAAVLCYRYAEHEKRLLPLPFDPRAGFEQVEAGFRSGPALIVESVVDAARAPFRAGDRLAAVNGAELRVVGDLARALGGVQAGESVEARVERDGKPLVQAWVPFPTEGTSAPADGGPERRRLTLSREELGFVLAGYPLAGLDGEGLGRTAEGVPFEANFPDGSYLLVFRRPEYGETRLPLRVAGKDLEVNVRLLRNDEVPPGFVHIPAGLFDRGGDPEAFQGFPLEEVKVGDLLIARYEVTLGEYLEYLNDPASEIDSNGEVVPAQESARSTLRGLVKRGVRKSEKLDLLPRLDSGQPLVRRGEDGKWSLVAGPRRSPRLPVLGISRFAAEEYALWLTKRRGEGIVRRYRLPADDEWEKAARGVDRRTFVWGDYPCWSFAWVRRGISRRPVEPEEVGFMTTDESVYGVRDLTGSVSEYAVGQPSLPYRYASVRGGNWFHTDEYYGRAATRNGLVPDGTAESTGFRLVAELKEEDGP